MSSKNRGGRPRIDTPSALDVQIGARLKERRVLAGFTLDKLAKDVGLTFQQIQKYEKGTNRVSASRLQQFADVLGTDLAYFVDGRAESSSATPDITRQDILLMRAFRGIPDAHVKSRVVDLVKSLAKEAMP